MTMSFDTIPANLRTPGFYIEFNNAAAGTSSASYRALLIGNGGEAFVNEIKAIGTADQAKAMYGDSQLAEMAVVWFANNSNVALNTINTSSTAAVLEAIGDDRFHYFASALNDQAEITILANELEKRYGGLSQNGGLAFFAKKGTYADLSGFGKGFNSHLISILGYNGQEVSEGVAAAIYGAKVAESLSNDSARPLQTLKLLGFGPFTSEGKFNRSERNNLLFDGISTYTISEAGEVRIERAITSYRLNGSGIEDASYLDISTPATLMYIRDYQRTKLSTAFPRAKLAQNGTNFPPGQPIVTPNIIKSTLVGIYEDLISLGLVEDVESYKKALSAEIPVNNPNRVDVLDKPNLVNQFMVFAMQTQFKLN